MTRTSTEHDGPGDYDTEAHDAGRGDRRFRRALIGTIVVLALLCAAFLGLGSLQGPKLSSAQVDSTRVVAQAGQQLRLFANQNVSRVAKSQVRVIPATDFSVTSTGEVIAVQFPKRLDYGTRYTVTVKGVTSQYQDVAQTFRYSFTTVGAQFYYLKRADPAAGGGQLDQIIRTGLAGTQQKVVYAAPHIQEFARFETVLAVVTQNDDGTSALSLVSLQDPTLIEPLQLPVPGVVSALHSAPEAGVLGFEFTASDGTATDAYADTLMTANLAGDHTVQPVVGLDGRPLDVLGWGFLGDSTSLVAQTTNSSVLLVDGTKHAVTQPLGQFTQLGQSSADGKTVVVGDIFGKIALTVATGEQKRLPALPVAGQSSFGGDAQLVGTSGSARVQQVAVVDASSGRYANFIAYEDGTTLRTLFRTKDDGGSFEGFTVSPNGQYVAVTVVPDVSASVSDGYAVTPMSTSVSTVFIDIASGEVVKSVEGFDESW